MAQPTWRIEVRDANLNRVGEIANFVALLLTLKFNDVGQFSLEVPYGGNSPAVESALAAPGCGLIFSRDYGNGTMTPLLSGPIWDNTRRGRDNTRVLDGWGDLWWLKARLAYPAGGRPYADQVLLNAATAGTGPLRYYRLGETSGTVATDSSGNAQNGTYTASPTLNQPGAIPGDTDPAVLFNGTSQYVAVPVAGLPSGNAAWTLAVWVKLSGTPSGNATAICMGTATNPGGWAALTVDNTRAAKIDFFGAGSTVSAALSTGVWHLLVGRWDGTTYKLNVDGGAAITGTPGARVVGTTGAVVGCGVGTSGTPINFFPGTIDEAAIWNRSLGDAEVAALYAAGTATHGVYDTRSGVASTTILGYVGANLTSPTNADRQKASMVLGADPVAGGTVQYDARYHNLLALCQWLAAAGGDIGFKALQSSGTSITFTTYQPQLASNALFSTELGNLLDFEYKVSGPTGNAAVVGGGNTGAARVLYEATDATTTAQYGRVEAWRDERGAASVNSLFTAGADELARQKLATNLSATPLDTPACAFQRDYNLGDKAAVVIDGAQIQDVIRQVAITLDARGNETITPAIGNPGSGQVGEHNGQQLTDTTVRRLIQLETRLATLTAAQ